MTNNYQYSIKVNEALERYGAKTCGTLERRVERLKRFTSMKNKQYAAEIRVADARMIAIQEREDRKCVRRNLMSEFNKSYDDIIDGVPVIYKNTPYYNLRSTAYGMNLLYSAIENGFVNAKRG